MARYQVKRSFHHFRPLKPVSFREAALVAGVGKVPSSTSDQFLLAFGETPTPQTINMKRTLNAQGVQEPLDTIVMLLRFTGLHQQNRIHFEDL